MAKPEKEKLTELELQIMQVIWKLGPSGVSAVREDMAAPGLHHRADDAEHPYKEGQAAAQAARPGVRVQRDCDRGQSVDQCRKRPDRQDVSRLQRGPGDEPDQEQANRREEDCRVEQALGRGRRLRMRALELWISGYLLNSLWQVPVVFAAAWVTARMVRRAGARVEHRVWVGALMLEAALPAFRLDFSQMWRTMRSLVPWVSGGSAPGGHAQVSFTVGPGSAAGVLWLPPIVLRSVAILTSGCLLYFAGRLLWGVWKTVVMQRRAEPVTPTGEFAQTWSRLRDRFCLKPEVGEETIGESRMISGPVTVGIARQMLLVPQGFLERVAESELEAVLAHELAHMKRQDFAKNLAYEALSIGIAYHPMLWMTRSRLAESREMVCDRMAAEAVAGREKYVRSLLRLASILSNRPPTRILHAIGIFDANIFERRVMNLTKRETEIRGFRRAAIVAACAVIGAVTCVSALALRMEVSGQAEQDKTPTMLSVSADKMQGNIIYKKNPVYPAEARASKDTLNGPVVLLAVINKEGIPVKLLVKQSLRADYDKSAMDAVREWRWKPFLLNGDPISVKTTITVNYQLAD